MTAAELQQRRRYRHFSKANNGINVQCWNAQFFHISDSDADVLVPAKEIANQTDIIIARTIKDPKDAGVKESAVALNFRHILSQISLKAKKSGEDLKVEIRSVALRNIPSTGTFKFRADDNADYTTDENITGSTSNPEQNLIPLENWTINAPNPAGSLTYGDGAAHNVNLQRYDYTLGEMVELDGTTAEAKDLLEGDQWLLIPQDFVKNNYYYGG